MSKSEGRKKNSGDNNETPEEKLLDAIQEENKSRQQALIKLMKKLNSGNK
ncbi:hypothetical protein [Mangrovivirga cuniculi]|nr:hypothetical protein [Mangrovivirga cuniculi]